MNKELMTMEKIVSTIRDLKVTYPEFRVGQILFIATKDKDVFNITDDELLKCLRDFPE